MKEYVRCDGCDNRIYLGETAFQFEGYCGIFCSAECFCNEYARDVVITKEEAENCYSKIYEEMVGENK